MACAEDSLRFRSILRAEDPNMGQIYDGATRLQRFEHPRAEVATAAVALVWVNPTVDWEKI